MDSTTKGNDMSNVILITGAGSGLGRLSAQSLALAGHTVYASMRPIDLSNTTLTAEMHDFAAQHDVDLRLLELDVLSAESAQAAAETVRREQGRIDVLLNNAAHLYIGFTEAFTPEQVLRGLDTNVVGALRVNQAFLPMMREQRSGLLLWMGSGSTRVVPPFLGPYTAAKAAFDSIAETVSYETIRFGIETSILMPGVFVDGTEHFPQAESSAREEVHEAYLEEYASYLDRNEEASRGLADGAAPDIQAVADEVVRVVGLEPGTRPFRTTIDFSRVGDIAVNRVAARSREEFIHRMGFADLLPTGPAVVDALHLEA